MKRSIRLVSLATCLWTAPLFASVVGHFNGYTTLSQSNGTLTSSTDADFVLDTIVCTGTAGYQMVGDHRIEQSDGGGAIAQMQWGVDALHYRATLYGTAEEGSCYSATNDGTAYLTTCDYSVGAPPFLPYYLGSDGPWRSDSACRPAPPNDPPPQPPPDQNGGNTDWSGTGSPIILAIDGGSFPLSGLADPVLFDITGDGHADTMGWTARGSSLAFLALDRNGNGSIDDGRELFGDATPLANGTRATNGFEALQEFDSNRDGVIDDRDPIWSSLVLWTDTNHDATSAASELQPIAASAVRAIDLAYRAVGRRDAYGNLFRYEATIALTHGRRSCYDVFFVVAR